MFPKESLKEFLEEFRKKIWRNTERSLWKIPGRIVEIDLRKIFKKNREGTFGRVRKESLNEIWKIPEGIPKRTPERIPEEAPGGIPKRF